MTRRAATPRVTPADSADLQGGIERLGHGQEARLGQDAFGLLDDGVPRGG